MNRWGYALVGVVIVQSSQTYTWSKALFAVMEYRPIASVVEPPIRMKLRIHWSNAWIGWPAWHANWNNEDSVGPQPDVKINHLWIWSYHCPMHVVYFQDFVRASFKDSGNVADQSVCGWITDLSHNHIIVNALGYIWELPLDSRYAREVPLHRVHDCLLSKEYFFVKRHCSSRVGYIISTEESNWFCQASRRGWVWKGPGPWFGVTSDEQIGLLHSTYQSHLYINDVSKCFAIVGVIVSDLQKQTGSINFADVSKP